MNLKDQITNVLAILMVVGGAVNAYLQSNAGDINWLQLGTAVVVAVVAWFTGKNPNGTSKEVPKNV